MAEVVTTLAQFQTLAKAWAVTDNLLKKEGSKKKEFSYLQWAAAWAKAQSLCPDIKQLTNPGVVIENELHIHGRTPGVFLLPDGTASVVAGVEFPSGELVLESLAVLDFKNNPTTRIDAAAVNNTIKRCLVKSLAMCGLGLTVYTGETCLPGTEKDKSTNAPTAAKAAQVYEPPAHLVDSHAKIVSCKTKAELTEIFAGMPKQSQRALHSAAAEHKATLA